MLSHVHFILYVVEISKSVRKLIKTSYYKNITRSL